MLQMLRTRVAAMCFSLLLSAVCVSAGQASGRYRDHSAKIYDKLSPVNGRFGQFHYRDFRGRDDIEIDPAWIKANIVTVPLPKIGRVECHKQARRYFVEAFNAIRDKKLGNLVLKFNGLWVPRYQRNAAHIPRNLSNHSWGSAIDLNFLNTKTRCANIPPYISCVHDGKNGDGLPSKENQMLWEEAFRQNNFRWGVSFPQRRRDPMHFEVK